MRKLKPNKEVLLQYLYDYGIKGTCKLFNLTEEEINSIQVPSKREYSQHKYNYPLNKVNLKIAKDISDNYNRLRSKYVGNKTNLQLSQTDEDIFHNTLLKVMSEGIEDNVVKQIEYRLKMVRYQLQMDNKQLKGIQTNALTTENINVCKNEE